MVDFLDFACIWEYHDLGIDQKESLEELTKLNWVIGEFCLGAKTAEANSRYFHVVSIWEAVLFGFVRD